MDDRWFRLGDHGRYPVRGVQIRYSLKTLLYSCAVLPALIGCAVNYGFAGIVLVLAILLLLAVFANDLNPKCFPKFIGWLDDLNPWVKLGVSIFAILFCTLWAVFCVGFGNVGPEYSVFQDRSMRANLWLPIVGFAPLFAFGVLHDSREHRKIRNKIG